MRQKIVWFVLGVFIGSLFVVAAYPNEKGNTNIQYGVPSVEKIQGNGYVTYLISNKEDLPLEIGTLRTTLQKILKDSIVKTHLKAYAIPHLPKGAVITGYGVKITTDGFFDALILASDSTLHYANKDFTELRVWAKEKPPKPLNVSCGKIGVPPGMKVRVKKSNGGEEILSGQSSPYWYNFGKVEVRYDAKPYGRLYFQVYVWALKDDNDPKTEYFGISSDERGDGVYRVDPGTELSKNGVRGYKGYFIDSMKITNDWGVDSTLGGQLGVIKPAGVIGNHHTVTIALGPDPSISYTYDPDGYTVYGDAASPKVVWSFDLPYDESASKHTIEFMGMSEGEVKEKVLHDRNWHDVVRITLWAKFRRDIWPRGALGILYHHESSISVDWYLKVG